MVEIRPTLPGDTWLILANLRQPEIDELTALGVTTEDAVRFGIAHSQAFTGFIDGDIAGIFGVLDCGDYQMFWGAFTQAIDKHPIAFIRAAYRWARKLDRTCVNVVDARNVLAVKWFRWLGFEVSDPAPVGVNGELFHKVRLH